MSAIVVAVESRVQGLRESQPDWQPVFVEFFEERASVEQLIRVTVLEQIQELRARRLIDAQRARELLHRQYLSDADVEEQTDAGKISLPGKTTTAVPEIDAEAEVRRACRASESGNYAIFVDGRQAATLSEIACFRTGSKILFLRTVPLVGG